MQHVRELGCENSLCSDSIKFWSCYVAGGVVVLKARRSNSSSGSCCYNGCWTFGSSSYSLVSLMAKNCIGVLVLWHLLMCFHCGFVEGAIGVNYGRVADNLPQPHEVAKLVQRLGIKNVKIYDVNEAVLRAFANTGISVIVCVPNNEIVSLANNPSAALNWVQTNVKRYFPATRITYIMVGNEVLSGDSSIWPSLVPAMQQLYSALRFHFLDTNIKISTPHSLGVLAASFPPSAGVFQPNIATSIMAPLLSFLRSTRSHFMINAYPYFAYRADGGQNIALNFALIEPGAAGFRDSNSGLHYSSLLEAMLDATIYAMRALNFNDIPLILTESGWPSKGDPHEIGASVTNARIYNNNLVRRDTVRPILGTPLRPGVEFDTYIFALFNENLKPGPTSQRNWGLYYPNLTQVYPINLRPTSQFSTNLALS